MEEWNNKEGILEEWNDVKLVAKAGFFHLKGAFPNSYRLHFLKRSNLSEHFVFNLAHNITFHPCPPRRCEKIEFQPSPP